MNTCKAWETIAYINRYCIGWYEEKEDVHNKTGNRVSEELWEKTFKCTGDVQGHRFYVDFIT